MLLESGHGRNKLLQSGHGRSKLPQSGHRSVKEKEARKEARNIKEKEGARIKGEDGVGT